MHDEGYLNEVEKAENRYFIVCPDQTTYSVILNLMLSENVIAQTKTKSKYWTRVTKKLEKGEMYRNTPSLSTPVQGKRHAVFSIPDRRARLQRTALNQIP